MNSVLEWMRICATWMISTLWFLKSVAALENEAKCNNILLVCGLQCTIFHAIIMSFYAFAPYSKCRPDAFCGEYICVRFNMPYFVWCFTLYLALLLSFSIFQFLHSFAILPLAHPVSAILVGRSTVRSVVVDRFVCSFIRSCIHSKLSIKVT